MENDSTYVFDHEKKEDIRRKIVIFAIDESEKEISLDFRVVMTAGIPATESNEEIHNGCNKKWRRLERSINMGATFSVMNISRHCMGNDSKGISTLFYCASYT